MFKLIFDKFPNIELEIEELKTAGKMLEQCVVPPVLCVTHEYGYEFLLMVKAWLMEQHDKNVLSGSYQIISDDGSFNVKFNNGYPRVGKILPSRDGTKFYLILFPYTDCSTIIDNDINKERFSKIIEKCLED